MSKTANDNSEHSQADWRLAEFLPYQLSITSNAVSDLMSERYRRRFGLKVPEWRVMAVLGDSDTDSATQQALTQATLMDKVAVNRACKVLEERGLIERVPNESDGRSHLLELTEEGRAIHREVMPLVIASESELFEGFTPQERQQFRELLGRMRQRAAAIGELSV
ncbi:MarR family winged helix-turn-helix transcriptional regulator [Erythrobacter crassostreae]|uniref:Winged helix-turn-helix transcriptional regulator n=1 Tax=Erythrobacter crassostreae TaxID=2828328 RepID=A0A9X1F3E2_9SPHN|nr:MarR family winged helix-turn-helix transcriptional regulator [Erythrobacter crassostrea]MBV7259251.1 winged helix-turn-helix transcriptional regulator [Erythrobacter crassostrea]